MTSSHLLRVPLFLVTSASRRALRRNINPLFIYLRTMTTPNHRSRTRLHLALTPPLRHFLDTLPPTDRFHAVRHLNDATPLPPPSSARLRTFIHIYKLIKDEPNAPSTPLPHLPLPIPKHPKMQTRSQTANNTTTNQSPPTTPPLTSRPPHPEHNDPNPSTTSRSSHHTQQPAPSSTNAEPSQQLTTPIPTFTSSQPSSQPHQTHPTAPQTHHHRSSSTTTTSNQRHSVPIDVHTPTFKSPENTLNTQHTPDIKHLNILSHARVPRHLTPTSLPERPHPIYIRRDPPLYTTSPIHDCIPIKTNTSTFTRFLLSPLFHSYSFPLQTTPHNGTLQSFSTRPNTRHI